MAREPVAVFRSPLGRVEVRVRGTAPLEVDEITWLRFLGGHESYINERVTERPRPHDGG